MTLLRMYVRLLVLAVNRAGRAWPVAFGVPLYAALLGAVGLLASPLGFIGGFVMGFAAAACLSSYLYFLHDTLHGARLTLRDVVPSFQRYFWDAVSLLFAFWIIGFAESLVLGMAGAHAPFVGAVLALLMAVFFNPVPELLYLGRTRSFELLADAARFVQQHWLEWFAPNLVLLLAVAIPTGLVELGHPGTAVRSVAELFSFSTPGRLMARVPLWGVPAVLMFVHVAMVFRGLLYLELSTGNARLRAFRERMRD